MLLAAAGIMTAACVFAQNAVESEIEEVTLFSNQAYVTRSARAKVEKGLQELMLEIDAISVDADSVSARVAGDGDIYSVQMKDVFFEEDVREAVRTLETRLEELNDQMKSLSNERQVQQNKEQFIKSLLSFSSIQVPQDMQTKFPSTADLENTMLFIEKEYGGVFTAIEKIDRSIAGLQKDISVAQRELNAVRGRSNKRKRVVEIVFDSARNQEIDIEARYVVYNAFWTPFYKVSVSDDLKDADLAMFARVLQQSGEDWENVKLSVSNAVPLSGAFLPEVYPWQLDLAQPPLPMRKRANMLMRMDGVTQMAMAPGEAVMAETDCEAGTLEKKREARVVMAERRELPLAFEYALPQKLSIESRDKEAILPIMTKQLNGTYYDYAVPQTNTDTFLVCAATADKELLPGPLNVHLGGRFIGKTAIQERKPGETFYVNLGVDRGVRIRRDKTLDKVQETFFGKFDRNTIVRELVYKITIENLKDQKTEIHLLDAVPVSRTDRIEVKDLNIAPEPDDRNYQDREGVMRWILTLNPKEKKEIEVRFTVTYPKDAPVQGL